MIRSTALWIALGAVAAGAASAQEPRVEVGAGPVYARPTGSLGRYLSGTPGLGGFVVLGSGRRAVGWRLDGTFLHFSPNTADRPFRGPQPISITTGSQLFAATGGPELRLRLGRLRLSAGAGAGLATSTNTGAVTGIAAQPRFSGASTFDAVTFAYTARAGVGVIVGGRALPLRLELSTRYLNAGPTRWVREGNLPVGYISGVYVKPTTSPTTLLVYQLSVSVGVSR